MRSFYIAILVLLAAALPSRAGDIFRDEIPQTTLNITTATVIKAAPGVLVSFAVLVAGAAGTINDTTTTGSVAASNAMAPIPATAGIYYFPMQFKNGLVVSPGASQVVAVSYQ